MTYADLENYQAVIRAPVEGTYRGYLIKAIAPPTSGGLTVIQMLKMLERFPLGDVAQGYGFGSLKTTNVMADAMRLAFADRSIWMGDPDFVSVPAKGLLDATYVGQRSAAIVPGARINPNPRLAIRARSRWPARAPARAWRWPNPSPVRARRRRISPWWTSGATW